MVIVCAFYKLQPDQILCYTADKDAACRPVLKHGKRDIFNGICNFNLIRPAAQDQLFY